MASIQLTDVQTCPTEFLEQEIRRGGTPHKNRHRISLGR
jgi:hypothetical protein